MDDVLSLIPMQKGHFRLESGHHGELWLQLESLFLRPDRVSPFATRLAERVRRHRPEVVCGPLVQGAFVALAVASTFDIRMAAPSTFGCTRRRQGVVTGDRGAVQPGAAC